MAVPQALIGNPTTQDRIDHPYSPLIANAAWLTGERAGTTSRTMFLGPTSENFFQAYAGWRHTPSEMKKWQEGTSWMSRSAWRGLGIGEKTESGSRRILGTPWAPSSWLTGMRVAQNPTAYPVSILNTARGRPMTSVTGGGFNQLGVGGSWSERYVANPLTTKMNLAEGTEAVNLMLGIGRGANAKYGGFFSKYIGDPILGSLINPELGGRTITAPWATTRGARGFAVRVAGAKMGVEALTPLGSTLQSVGSGIGIGLKGLSWADAAYQLTKLVYKTSELMWYKVPKAAYGSVLGQLTRPAFSSGDASLLQGIPANNRMRAVQAIQGSRMNARSALGNEASLLSGHFG
jgi:hypothetical protein